MNRIIRSVGLLLTVWVGVATSVAAQDTDGFKTSPTDNQGRKWRIAYYEGGSDEHYFNYLRATAQGLLNLGWIRDDKVPEFRSKNTRDLWNWLVREARAPALEFVADQFYTSNWDEDERRDNKERAIASLRRPGNVDLIIAMGTWAGIDLATDAHGVPTIVMSTSDPVRSGIISSIADSGRDHVHARVDPARYERQVRIFHDIVGFKRLGVAYEDSQYGRTYAAIDLIEKVAVERGFEVVKCHTQSDIADLNLAGRSVKNCFRDLSSKVDAIYVTIQGGVNSDTIPELVQIANDNRVPTFSQSGSKEVESGFLLSISRPGYRSVGVFLAATIAKVLNGARPRQLKQLFEETPNIAINLKTAEIVGLYLYADILAAADQIYRDISLPER